MDKETESIVQKAGGEIVKVIQLEGEVLEGETLDSLQSQAGAIEKFDTLVLEIASPGGSVSEGLDIMIWLEDLSKQGKQIVTVVTANAYSIASLIMLVADIKLISKHAKVMVHNPMVPLLEYVNANDLQEYINSLRSLEGTMYELYKFFTGLETEQIKKLMDNETYLLPQEAVDNGFADMVIDIKQKPYSMASNIKKEINMSKTLNILNKVIGMVNKSEFINQLYSDLEGKEIEIFQKDASTYMVGDRTSMVEGEVVLSDGAKLTIVASEITDISRSAKEESTATENVVAVETEVAVEVVSEEVVAEEVVAEEVASEEVVAEEVVAVEAVAVKEEAKEEKMSEEPEAVKEYAKEEATDVEAIIEDEPKEDEPKEDEPKEDEPKEDDKADDAEAAEFNEGEAPKAMDEEMVVDNKMAEMQVVIMDLSARVAVLENICMGYDMKLEAISKFENIATEAIDTLASNTVSNFKPEAVSKTKSNPSVGGSIFSQLKAKSGLN